MNVNSTNGLNAPFQSPVASVSSAPSAPAAARDRVELQGSASPNLQNMQPVKNARNTSVGEPITVSVLLKGARTSARTSAPLRR